MIAILTLAILVLGEDLLPCASRTRCNPLDPNCLPLWPCGNDTECFLDMGAFDNSCILKSTPCTNSDHYYKDFRKDETFEGQRIETLDLVFMIDATGTMKHTISAALTLSGQLAASLEAAYPMFNFRFAAVMYRDPLKSSSVHQVFDFTDNVDQLVAFFSGVKTAHAGGDGPEDVAGGFELVKNNLTWLENTPLKGMSLKTITQIGDAPPHGFKINDKLAAEKTKLGNVLRLLALDEVSLSVLSLNGQIDVARDFYNQTFLNASNPELTWVFMNSVEVGEKFIESTLLNVGHKMARYNHTCKLKTCTDRTANSSSGNWRCGTSTEAVKCLQDIGGDDELKCVVKCSNILYEGSSSTALSVGKCVLKECSTLNSSECIENSKCRYQDGSCIENPCVNKTIDNCGNCTLLNGSCWDHDCVPLASETACPRGCVSDADNKCVNDTCRTYNTPETCEKVTSIECVWETDLVFETSRCVLNMCSQLGGTTCGEDCVYHLSKKKCIPNPCKSLKKKDACIQTDCQWTVEEEKCEYHDCVRIHGGRAEGAACPATSVPCVKDASDMCKVNPCEKHVNESSCNETECFWKLKNATSTVPTCEYQVCVRLQNESSCYPGCKKVEESKCVPDICQKALNITETTGVPSKCPSDCNTETASGMETCEWQSCVRQPHVAACVGWAGRPCVQDKVGRCIEQVDCSKINSVNNCLKQITCEWDFTTDSCNPNLCLNCSQSTCYPISVGSCRNNTCGDLVVSSVCLADPVCYWDYQENLCKLSPCNKTCDDETDEDTCKLDSRGACVPNDCLGLDLNECLRDPACQHVDGECKYNPCTTANLPNGTCLLTEPCVFDPERGICLPANCTGGDCVTKPDWCRDFISEEICPRECVWIASMGKCRAGPCTRFPEASIFPLECPLQCVFYHGRLRTVPGNAGDECVADPCVKHTLFDRCPGDCLWEDSKCRVGPCTMLDDDECLPECQFGSICGGGPCLQIENCQDVPGCKVNPNTSVGASPCKDDECYKYKNVAACTLNTSCAWIDGECESKDECTVSLNKAAGTCRDGCFLDPLSQEKVCIPDPCAAIDSPVACLQSENVLYNHICRRRDGHCRAERVCPDVSGSCLPEYCRLEEGVCLPNPCPAFAVEELCVLFSNCSWLDGRCDWNPCAIDPPPQSAEACVMKSRGCEMDPENKTQCVPDTCVKQYYPGAECKGHRECVIEDTTLFGTTCVYDPDKAQQAPEPSKFPYWTVLVGALVVTGIVGAVGAAAVYVWKKKKTEKATLKVEDVGAQEMNDRDADALENEDGELMEGGGDSISLSSENNSSSSANSERSEKSRKSKHSRSKRSKKSKKSSSSKHSKSTHSLKSTHSGKTKSRSSLKTKKSENSVSESRE